MYDPYLSSPFGVAAHPWIRSNNVKIPLDILVYRLVRNYLRASSMRKAALKVSVMNQSSPISVCCTSVWRNYGFTHVLA